LTYTIPSRCWRSPVGAADGCAPSAHEQPTSLAEVRLVGRLPKAKVSLIETANAGNVTLANWQFWRRQQRDS
jgi:hypothetical protein